jgi:hypothetical protein
MLSPQALALDLAASIDSSLNSASAACAARTLLPSGVVLRCGLSLPAAADALHSGATDPSG